MKRVVEYSRAATLLLLLATALGCASGATIPCNPRDAAHRADDAWWLSECFDVQAETIEGLKAADIDPSWSAAMVLTESRLPAIAHKQGLCDPSLRFRFDGDFNKDTRPDRAVVGVYRDRSNKVGQFLLILTRSAAGKWTPAFVSKLPGRSGFSTLSYKDKELNWWMCCACDDGARVVPKGTGYALKPFEFGD